MNDKCQHCGGEIETKNTINSIWRLHKCNRCARDGITKVLHITQATQPTHKKQDIKKDNTVIIYFGDVFDSEWTKESKKLCYKNRDLPEGVLF